MTIVSVTTPLRSNGEAPNTLNGETQPAASLPGLGLAGVASASSHVKAAENPPQKSHVDPKFTVKASDLQDRGQTGAIDEPAKFDLMPEHPKLRSMPSANHIGFLPGTHYDLTLKAARDAGLPDDLAMKLAKLVKEVDDQPHSQDAENSVMHAMRVPGESMASFNWRTNDYIARCQHLQSLLGLALLLHRMQDSHSKSHTGPDGVPLEWHGLNDELINKGPLGPLKMLWHVFEDTPPFPGGDLELNIRAKGARLIQDYVKQCGWTFNK
jgi:hypothetical protein